MSAACGARDRIQTPSCWGSCPTRYLHGSNLSHCCQWLLNEGGSTADPRLRVNLTLTDKTIILLDLVANVAGAARSAFKYFDAPWISAHWEFVERDVQVLVAD